MTTAPDKRLRYGELDRALVVAAAVRLATRGGIRSVTVRALATELGLSTTAMYRYVDGKAALLNLVAEATLAKVELPETGPWQHRVRLFADSARQAMLVIDGIAEVLQTHPAKGAARQVDSLLHRLVVDAGVPESRHESVRMLLMIFVQGSVSWEQSLAGLAHQLTVAPDSRFQQGLDVLIAGIEAMSSPAQETENGVARQRSDLDVARRGGVDPGDLGDLCRGARFLGQAH
jgi:AcrR family transcriptional regulator